MAAPALHPSWLVPDWPAPGRVRAVFTSRAGGVSPVPWDSLNLGSHVGDGPAAVAANRARLQQATGLASVYLKQVHGAAVALLGGSEADGLQADAAVTFERQVACTVLVADCLPVLLADADGHWVAAAHAGWRGLAGAIATAGSVGVLEATAIKINEGFSAFAHIGRGFVASKTIAWLGPCIGPGAFEVGKEVRAAFVDRQAAAAACFRPAGPEKYLADLAALARLQLQGLGIDRICGNDGSPGWCTVGNPGLFFSHRRDAAVAGNHGKRGSQGNGFGTTGRMAASIWLA